MTSTTRATKRFSRRGLLRLSSMESLGFLDSPNTIAAKSVPTTSTSVQPAPLDTVPAAQTVASTSVPAVEHDPFANWRPTEVGGRLDSGNVRWGFLIGLLMIAAGLVGVGYWIYQQPAAAAAAAGEELVAVVDSLEPHLGALASLNASLTLPAIEPGTSTLSAARSAARNVFDTSATLPPQLDIERSISADIAGDALDAARLVGDAIAFKGAVIPILAAPKFETDPDLIAIDDAAREFGAWQAQFDSVRTALSPGMMSVLNSELTLISGELESIQNRYLDAIRTDDRFGTHSAINDLGNRLSDVENILNTSLSDVQERANQRIDDALSGIALIRS